MATVDEVLAKMSDADVIGGEDYPFQYVIDNDLRIITVPSNGVTMGVEGDKDVNLIKFQMPRYYKKLDLSDFSIRVNYVNAKAEPGYYNVEASKVTEDKIVFGWVISAHVAKYMGSVQFAVTLTKLNDTLVDKKFNTTIGKANVLDGLAFDGDISDEEIKDLLAQILDDVMKEVTPSVQEAKQAAKDAAASAEKAEVAQTAAETAQTAAETAQTASETAQTAAELAQAKAEESNAAKEQATHAAQIAQETLTKAPYIGDNNHWFTYSNGVATDTGVEARGEKGSDGAGVVAGGMTGQVLAKKSDADYDTEWVDNTGSIPDGIVTSEKIDRSYYILKNGTEPINGVGFQNEYDGSTSVVAITQDGIYTQATDGLVDVNNVFSTVVMLNNNLSGEDHSINIGYDFQNRFDGIGFSGNSEIKPIDDSSTLDITATNVTATKKFSTSIFETQMLDLKGDIVGIKASDTASFVVGGNPFISGNTHINKKLSIGDIQKDISISSSDTDNTLQINAAGGLTVNDKKVLVEGDIPEPEPNENILKGTKSGAVCHVDDAWPTKLLGLNIYGKTEQVTTTGANIFDVSKVQSSTFNGITATVNPNGSITFTGTNTAASVVNFDLRAGLGGKDFVLPTGKYISTLSGASKLSLTVQLADGTFTTTTTTTKVIDNKMDQTLTYFLVQIPQGATVNETLQVWFEKGEKSLKEPYTGGKPSPSPEYPQNITNLNNAEIVTSGQNLINLTDEDYLYTNNAATYLLFKNGVKVSFTKEYSYVGFIIRNMWQNEPLVFSTAISNSLGKTAKVEIYGTNTRTYMGGERLADNRVVFNPKHYKWLRILFYANPSSEAYEGCTIYNNISLEVAEKSNTFKPYVEPVKIPIDLKGNELYNIREMRDILDVTTGTIIKNVEKFENLKIATHMFGVSTSNGKPFIAYPAISFVNFAVGVSSIVYCDKYSYASLNSSAERGCYRTWNSIVFFDTAWENAEQAVKELTAANPTVICHVPRTIIPLGKIDIPSLPETISNVWTNSNVYTDTGIEYVRDVSVAFGKLESAIAANALDIATQ